jgi:hypothetical protein
MNSVLTNATFLALLIAVCVYVYQKWSAPTIKRRSRSGRIKTFREKIWLGWPIITGAVAWLLIFCYQQFYRDDAKPMKLISDVSNVSNVLDNGGIGIENNNNTNINTNTNTNTNMTGKGLDNIGHMNGIHIPFDLDDEYLPSVFIPSV